MKLSEYQIAQFIKVVLAGQPGRGKTSIGLTFPTPMLIFDFDGKLDGPILYAKRLGIDLSQIEVETVTNWQSVVRILDKEISAPRYKTYGFDSLTSMADTLLGQIGDVKAVEKDGKVKRIGGVQVAGLEEYLAESSGIMDLLLFMKTVKAHLWLTAHVLETKSQVTGDDGKSRVVVNRALLTGGKKVAAKIPAYFPENYSINIEADVIASKPPHYFVHTASNTEDYGRTGFNLPARFEITNGNFFQILMKLINEKNTLSEVVPGT